MKKAAESLKRHKIRVPNIKAFTSTCLVTDDSESLSEDDDPPQKRGRGYYYPGIPGYLWNDWKWQFRNRIMGVAKLAQYLTLSKKEINQLKLVTRRFPMSVTPYYLSLIDPNNEDDPIRKQVIPSFDEIDTALQGYEDPLGEIGDSVMPGLVHRYEDRALLAATNICPVLCRHCTRKREWHKNKWVRTQAEIQAMLGYIAAHREIKDVIISGGDPLTLATNRLEEIVSGLRSIKHVEIIRIGSRLPVVLPQRIDEELCNMLSKYGPIWLNTHFNSSYEITPEAASACERLLRSGIPVNNQSVLLKGINDNPEEMLGLCQGLLRIKVRPYYLFQCDEVQGVEHLRTPVEKGVEIIAAMRGHTSGLSIPSFVVDLPNGGGKVPLLPGYIMAKTGEEILFKNYQGRLFPYRNPGTKKQEEQTITIETEGVDDADRVIV